MKINFVKFHAAMMVLWAALAIPTIIVWKESILWVAFMSLYANFASHFAAMDAARAERKIDSQTSDG